MKRKIMSLALSVVLILLSVLLLNNEKVVEAADNFVLLEKRHPGYGSYLMPYMGTVVSAPPKDSKNLLISDFQSQSVNGITFTVNEDRTITLNGANTGESFNVFLGDLKFPKGEYVLSDGVDPSIGIDMYVWDGNQNKMIAEIYNNHLIIDSTTASYQCGFFIAPEATFDSVTVYPMIRSMGDDSYSPYTSTDDSFNAVVFEADKKKLSTEDYRVFEKIIKTQYADFDWVSILYTDGTGTQWIDDSRIDGAVDIWGRI